MAGDVGGVELGVSGPIAAVVAVVSATLGAFGLWLANRMLGKAAFQTAINDGFAKLTADLQEERDSYRKQLAEERQVWAGAEARLRGEISNLSQTIESLKALLRRSGIAVPETHQPAADYVILEGDRK